MVAVFGDPAMLLVPALGLAAVTIMVVGLGAPGRPELIVPALAAPPADAFTDAAVLGLVERTPAVGWAARVAAIALRALVFGSVAAVAAARAAGEMPSLAGALRRVARCAPALAFIAALAAAYAWLASGGGPVDPGRDAGVAGTALVGGMLFLPGAFVAAVTDGRGPAGSLRRSGRWVLRRPLGHLGLVAGYALAFGGAIRLALFGEVARPRALPVTLYALVAALVTAVFAAALARRHALLYADAVHRADRPRGGIGPARTARRQPGESATRSKRAGTGAPPPHG